MTDQTSAGMIATAERRNFVMKCRKRGATYAQIAALAVRKFGTAGLPKHWDGRSAYKDVKRELEKLRADTTETTDEVRQIALQRLDAMHTGLWTKATKGNAAAIDRVLKIMERRAKLLGIDAPTRGEITGRDGKPIEFENVNGTRDALLASLPEPVADADTGQEAPMD